MNSRCRSAFHTALILLLLACAAPTLAATCRVTPTGSGDGSDWLQAASLQGALADAACTEIWVAQGSYTPDGGSGDRSAHFAITRELRLLGGFSGSETSLEERASRDPALTVLSGEIGDPGDTEDNSYRLIQLDASGVIGGFTADTVIDGFTLRDAQGTSNYPDNMGAALYCYSPQANRPCSPLLTRLHFTANHAIHGGALALRADCCLPPAGGIVAPLISDTVFDGNRAQNNGGAIYALASAASSRIAPLIQRSTFMNNTAHFAATIGSGGGAIYLDAGAQGGVIDLLVQNTSFSGNAVASFYGRGGAIYNRGFGGPSTVRLDQVTFFGNVASFQGEPAWAGQSIYAYGERATTVVERSIVADADPFRRESSAGDIVLAQSVVPPGAPCPAGAACTDAIEGDPLLGPLQDNGGATPSLLPGAGGVAVDAVDCGDALTDQRGIARPQGLRCDVGSVEHRLRILTLELDGNGSIAITRTPGATLPDCTSADSPCLHALGENDEPAPVFSFTLTPDTDWTFAQWSGDCTADGTNPLRAQLTLDASKSCIAHLLPPNQVVTLLADPPGGGTLQVLDGIDPDAVPQGTELQLLATPNPGWDVADPAAFGPSLDCGSALDIELQADGTLRFASPPIMQDCSITARFANQAPSFAVASGEVVALVNGAPVSLAAWATDIRSGSTNDPAQSVQFQVALIDTVPTDAQLFASGGEPTVEADGTLHFVPGPEPGSALFQVRLVDDGGSANGGSDASAAALLLVRIARASTDLSLHPEVPATFNFPGDPINFVLRVDNAGPQHATQARVQWAAPPELSGVAWFCDPQGSATCTASGSGSIDDTIDIPANGSLSYLIEATLPAPAPATIENQALVSPGPDQADPDPDDDIATWLLRIDGLLRDGFEE